MKKLLVAAFVLFQVSLFAQNGEFTLRGKVGTLNNPAIVYLSYQSEGKIVKDSAVLKNGEFVLKGNVANPVRATLNLYPVGKKAPVNLRSVDYLQFVLDAGNINFESKDSIKLATISGSKINDENAKLKELTKAVDIQRAEFQALTKDMTPEKQKDEAFMTQARKKYDELMELGKQVALKFIQENPDSWLCFEQLRTIGGYQPDVNVVEPLFNGLSERVKNTTTGKAYAANIVKWHKIAVGMIAPDFTQNDPDDKPVKLSDFRGKYVLLDFWASWCGPCRAENPNVVKAYNQYKEKNFTVLSVSLDHEGAKDAWLAAVKKDNMTWNHVSDLKYWKNEVAVQYTIQAIPDNFLLGPDGKILARGLRGEALSTKLAELLK